MLRQLPIGSSRERLHPRGRRGKHLAPAAIMSTTARFRGQGHNLNDSSKAARRHPLIRGCEKSEGYGWVLADESSQLAPIEEMRYVGISLFHLLFGICRF